MKETTDMKYESTTKYSKDLTVDVVSDENLLSISMLGNQVNNLSDIEQIDFLISELNKYKVVGGFPNK